MKINDDDLKDIENFIRNELYDVFKEKCQQRNVEFNEKDMEHFYGCFQSSTSNFRFLSGEKKLIQVLAEYAKEIHETDKIKNTNSFEMPCNYKFSRKDTNFFPFGLYFGKSESRIKSSKNLIEMADVFELSKPENMKDVICRRLNDMIKTLGIPNENLFSNDSVKIINRGNKLQSNITCALCKLDSKVKTIIAQAETRNNSTAIHWNFGNLKKHIKKMHKAYIDEMCENYPPLNSDDESIKPKRMKKKLTASHSNFTTLELKIEPTVEMNCEDDQIEHGSKSTEDGEKLQISDGNVNLCEDFEKLVYKQMAAQNLFICEKNLLNSDSAENMDYIISKNISTTLKLSKIAADGNCLFGALSHQIFGWKIGSKDHRLSTSELRDACVKRIKDKFEEYESWFKGTVDDCTENECKFYLNFCLPKDGCWAGSESIKAISDIYKINIIIFNENDTFYFHHNFNPDYTRCVAIAYRKYHDTKSMKDRNHYDSVVEMNSGDLYKCAKKLVTVHLNKQEDQNSSGIYI